MATAPRTGAKTKAAKTKGSATKPKGSSAVRATGGKTVTGKTREEEATATAALARPRSATKDAPAKTTAPAKAAPAKTATPAKAAAKAAPAKTATPAKAASAKAAPAKTATPAKAAPAKTAAALSPADAKALLKALEARDVAKVKALLAKGRVSGPIATKYGGETTALLTAVRARNVELVELVLAAGGKDDLELADSYGGPLHQARDLAIVEALLGAGAAVDAKNGRGRTPLHVAAAGERVDVVARLLAAGATVDAEDAAGDTPFVLAKGLGARQLLRKAGSRGLPVLTGTPTTPLSTAGPARPFQVRGGAIGAVGGALWAWSDEGLFCWDGQELTHLKFAESFTIGKIASGAGRVYFATNWGLLVLADGAFRLYDTKTSELHDNHITELFVDRAGRAVMMGYGDEEETDRPISIFDGERFTVLTAGDGFAKGHDTLAVAFDAAGRAILGTTEGVVYPDGHVWESGEFANLGDVGDLVPVGDTLWAITARKAWQLDPRGKELREVAAPERITATAVAGETLWFGLSHGGVLRVRGAEHTRFSGPASGLTNDDVRNVAVGSDGSVWVDAGGLVHQLRGDRFVALAAPSKAAPPKPRTFKPIPKTPIVPRAKLPAHVVAAIEGANLEARTREALFALVRPAVGVVIGEPARVAVGGSKLGGRADLPEGESWPTFADDEDRALPFLLQVDLADVAPHDLEGLLPKTGGIAFFADTQPDELEESCARYAPAADPVERLPWPDDLVARSGEKDFVAQLPEHPLHFFSTWTVPSAEYLERHVALTETEGTALRHLAEALRANAPPGAAGTRLLGWPEAVQGEIVSSPDDIVLLQIDAAAKASGKLDELFGYWGRGVVHAVVPRKALAKGELDDARLQLAYT